jgi:hypothetical protein
MATGVYPSQKHVAEARRRGLSCNGSTSTRSVARSTTTSTPSRSRPSSVVQSSGNITFCYDPSQTLAYRTEKPSCDTNDFEITSAEYDRRRGGKSNNTLTTTSRPAAPPPPPRNTGNAQWGVYAGSTPPVPVSQALAICGSEARMAGLEAGRRSAERNEAVNCRTDYAGGYSCKRGSSGGGALAGFFEGLSKGLAESRAEKSTLQRCMATYSYIAK